MCSHFWEVTETCGAQCSVHYTSLRASASPFGNFEHCDGIDFRCRACACGGAAMSGRSSRPASLNMLIRWPRFSYDPPSIRRARAESDSEACASASTQPQPQRCATRCHSPPSAWVPLGPEPYRVGRCLSSTGALVSLPMSLCSGQSLRSDRVARDAELRKVRAVTLWPTASEARLQPCVVFTRAFASYARAHSTRHRPAFGRARACHLRFLSRLSGRLAPVAAATHARQAATRRAGLFVL